jgi:S1-C subfamily serine protease
MFFGGLLISLLASCQMSFSADPLSFDVATVPACSTNSKGLKRSRESSVLITFESGGIQVGKASGNYFKYRGNTFVLTAAHVAEVQGEATIYVNERAGIDKSTVRVVYVDHGNDIAVLALNRELETIKPIKWRRKERWDVKVGEHLYYTGNPMDLEHIAFEGFVSKIYLDTIVMQGFAYMGSSGSAVFDSRGRVVGVVSAIKFDMPFGAFPQLLPAIVMVGPLNVLDNNELHDLLENK